MSRQQTPSQTVGPFFHVGLTRRTENRLVGEDCSSPRIRIEGRVVDGAGQGVPDAMLEIWQADARGIYDHPRDPRRAEFDPHFRGFGRAATDKSGRFFFETVKPGGRDEEAPHINVTLFARGILTHALTCIYFEEEPDLNAADPVFRTVPEDRRPTLLAVADEDKRCYRFNIVLQGERETVFFNP